MRSDKHELKRFIQLYNFRAQESGSEFSLNDIVGISSISKSFVPTKANLVGVEPDSYKIVPPGYFAYNPNTARMGDKVCIALNQTEKNLLVSSIYPVFQVDSDVVLPEYLLLWFKRPEFDRWARFVSHGSAREVLDWKQLSDYQIIVPSLQEQSEIVKCHKTVTDRIELLKHLNSKLEEFAYAAYMSLIENNGTFTKSSLGETAKITTGKLNSEDAVKDGLYPFFTCSQETYRTDTYSFDQEAVLLAGNNASAIYPLKLYKGKFNAYQRTYVISSKNGCVSNKQLYFVLRNKLKDFREQSYGTTTKFLTMTILSPIEVLVPSEQVFNEFSKIADSCFDMIAKNNRELDLLETTRLTLLSNLVNGGY